jgi:hypothetical protein
MLVVLVMLVVAVRVTVLSVLVVTRKVVVLLGCNGKGFVVPSLLRLINKIHYLSLISIAIKRLRNRFDTGDGLVHTDYSILWSDIYPPFRRSLFQSSLL